ncbi:glycoside hydrolase family 68 protein [Candidatus Phycosocius spiralis]|uniref:Glycoside hydrolase 68 family protein n=1 Tax=Candidatus Phycosocius spiralis TaxID=2815099 RepID=A0ABQ4PWS4_9PROT|nr:glycoside hydrolase family 68 protein [Candidatus Phycosocius spiralis]GIU67385.1 glycoside hydrolase 68 family protein [Candidatus Phycosocius spiralis]
MRGIFDHPLPCPRVFEAQDIWHFDPSQTLWDIWGVQTDAGDLAQVDGASLWVMLCAPRAQDPDMRHTCARLRLLMRRDRVWHDCGNLLPDGFSPGSREWSGSTRLDLKTNVMTLWFTASGRRGEEVCSFEQRLFHAQADLVFTRNVPVTRNWRDLTQSVINTGQLYTDVARTPGIPGRIKGFRDPYWFRDPANGQGYLLFTASKPEHQSTSHYDGVIGIAQASDRYGLKPFELMPALIDADGLTNELERPHVFVYHGLYYLFWSTQKQVFNPSGVQGPTGLYGMVAPSLFGPYQPLNGTGLVLANPSEEPLQAYAWQVLPSLEVVSFVDYWGLKGRDPRADHVLKARQFGGSIAPSSYLELHGAKTRIVSTGS